METNNFNYVQSQEQSSVMSKTFIASVFSWMFTALLISGATAYLLGHNEEFLRLMFSERGLSGFGYLVVFSPLVFSLVMNMGMQRFSYMTAVVLFLAFSIIMGMSLSMIFLIYSLNSILFTFMISAASFGIMSLMGYTTATDLTKLGTYLIVGAVGVVAVSWLNFYVQSDTMDFVASAIGVIVFTGLAAYQVQTLKKLGAEASLETAEGRKYAVWGAFGLYITFINLFLSLLRFTGNRR
jgi:FtsH-binding integral membrane protein